MSNPHLQRLALLRAFAPRLALGLLFMALTVLVELGYPRALSYFIDHIGLKSDGAWFAPFAATVTAVLALQAVATTMRYYLFESTGHMIVTRIRRQLYGALIRQPVGFYDKHNVGELTSRLSADVEILHDTLTMGLAISLRSLCLLAGCVVMLLLISPVLSLILLVYVPLTLYMGDWLGRHVRQRSRDIQQRQAECGSVAHEYFTNIRLAHAFNQQRAAGAKYAEATAHALTAAIANTRLLASFRGVSSFVMYLALLVTLWLGARLIGQGSLSVGELTSFVIYAGMATSSSGAVSDFWSDWMRTIGAPERVFEIIESEAPLAAAPAGVPSDRLDVAGVRAHIAIVEQEPSLFSGSIFENIAFAVPDREVTRDEVAGAARLANAHDFIAGFPHGYDTVVDERGVQLSGGQKQRIAIARALLRDPKILILDEATSALDSASELQVQQALDKLMEGRTTIVIAHRYSTIVKADRVLVPERGAIVQQGAHADLIQRRGGLYFRLMENQLSAYRTG